MAEKPSNSKTSPAERSSIRISGVSHPHVVGIGASAGGLEALSQFVGGLTPGLECISVVAQHMSSTHRSMMAEILARETRIPVRELVDNELPRTDIVYIIPPGTNLTFQNGCFHLTTPSPEVAPKPSINLMFQSMADEFDERAIGIVLSDSWFLNECKDAVATTQSLEALFPQQFAILGGISGMMAIKTRSPRSGWVRFYWFRPAEPQEVAWAGNPNKPVVENTGVTMLSPRRSFEKWVEIKSGFSRHGVTKTR